MMVNDVTYVYDYVNNTFTSISLPTSSSQNNNRFGHFGNFKFIRNMYKNHYLSDSFFFFFQLATILNQSNYLLLAFGFNDIDTGTANTINILNVADPYHPSWVTQTIVSPTSSPSNNTNNNNNNQGNQNGLSGGVIAAIVIVVIVVVNIYIY